MEAVHRVYWMLWIVFEIPGAIRVLHDLCSSFGFGELSSQNLCTTMELSMS